MVKVGQTSMMEVVGHEDDEHGTTAAILKDAEKEALLPQKKVTFTNAAAPHADADTTGEEKPTGTLSALRQSAKIAHKFITALFSTTTHLENLILLLGCLLAAVHGSIFPFVAIIFGCMTNQFIQQFAKGYANVSANGLDSKNSTEDASTNSTVSSMLDQLSGVDAGVGVVDKVFGGMFDSLNKLVLSALTENQVLTREEFIQSVEVTGKLFCFLAVVVFLTSFLQVLCWEWVAVNQKYSLRRSVLRRIFHQNLTWYCQHDSGELINNVFNEVACVREAIGFQFCSIIQCLAMFVASSILGFLISWRMSLVFLSPVPVLILRTLTLGEKIGGAAREGLALLNSAEKIQTEALHKLDTVVAFGQQQKTIARFGSTLEAAADALMKKFHLTAWGRALIYVSIYASYAGAFWYGCRLLLQHQITPGEIYAIFLAATMGTVALIGALGPVTLVGNAYGAATQLHDFAPTNKGDLIDSADKSWKLKGKLKAPAEVKGEIEFEGVQFFYPATSEQEERPTHVLKDLSFKIPAGKTIMLFGDSLAGKTTIANLILRLYDPTAGSVRIDGVDLKEWPGSLTDLRAHIGYAAQHVQLMPNQTVNENIMAGRDVTWTRLEDVRELVDSSRELKTNDEDWVPVCSAHLSMSAKAKIHIARALLTDPPILILDDVFKQVAENERGDIKQNVLKARQNAVNAARTTIIITNNTLDINARNVDLVCLVRDGQVTAEDIGSFDELYFHEGGSQIRTLFDYAQNQGVFRLDVLTTKEGDDPETAATTDDNEAGGGKQAAEAPAPGLVELYGVGGSDRKLFILGLIGCILSGAQLAIFSYYFVEMFGTFTKTGSALNSGAIFWSAMLLLLAFIAAAGIWLRVLFTSAAALYLVLRIRTTALASVIRRPKAYYDTLVPRVTPSTLGARVAFAVPSIRHALQFSVPEGMSTVFTLAIVAIIVSALVWQIGMILVTGVCVTSLLAFCVYKTQHMAMTSFQAVDAAASTIILSGLDVIELVQSFAMQETYLRLYDRATAPGMRRAHLQAVVFSTLYALCETVIFAFFGVSFLYGARLIETMVLEPGCLFQTFVAMAICIISFSQSVSLMPALARAAGDLDWINGLVREEARFDSTLDPSNEEGFDLGTEKRKGLSIEFVDVHFAYQRPPPEGEGKCGVPCKVLKGLNLLIQAGGRIILTGPRTMDVAFSESAPFGGTTIMYLIQRFYDVTSGHLLIDDRDIKTLNIKSLRSRLGIVAQNPIFFEGSLADNLVYGNEMLTNGSKESNDTLLTEALVKAQIHDQSELHSFQSEEYWRTLPRGTKVQIAMARALLRRPLILLIDSPTSAMSPKEAGTVRDVLRVLCDSDERTIVVATSDAEIFGIYGTSAQVMEDGKAQPVTEMMGVC